MDKFHNNFDEQTLKLLLCTVYSSVEEKQKLNELLDDNIFKYRNFLDKIEVERNEMNIIRDNLRKMENLLCQQSKYITNGKMLIKHLIHKINNPNASELPIFRYVAELDEIC